MLDTGLPTKVETAETIVQNVTVYFLVFSILCNFKLGSFVAMSINRP